MPSQISDSGAENGAGDVLLKPTGGSVAISAANGSVNTEETVTVGLRLDQDPLPSIRSGRSGEDPPNPRSDGVSSRMLGDEAPLPPVLETVAERRARRRSHYVAYVTSFVMAIGFSIVLTGVWPYLQQLDNGVSKEFLGWVIAANPVGQMLASPVLGYLGNKAGSNRGVLLVTVFMFIVGNAFYAILSVFGSAARAMMIFSRFLVGVSSANIAIIRSYIAASTTVKERTAAVSFISAAQGFGFIIGPALQAGLTVLFSKSLTLENHQENAASPLQNSTALQAAIALGFDEEKPGTANSTLTEELIYEEIEGPQLEWTMYTAVGWFSVLLGLINFLLFMPCVFQEHPIAAKEAQLQKQAANDTNFEIPKPDYKALVCVLFSFFIILFLYVLLETLLVPMTMDLYAWTDRQSITVVSIGLSIAGVIVVIMFSSVGLLSKKFDERKVYLVLGLTPMLLSMVCFFPMGSTYPKMQNCTKEYVPDHKDIAHFMSSMTNHSEYLKNTTVLPLLSSNPVSEVPDILDTLHSHNPSSGNYSSHKTLSRRRRHAARSGKCHDTGCPPEQEWCLYTPIIEKSQLGVACIVAVIGYPVAFAISSSLFSKLLGPKPQGFWMGILTSTGSFSRAAGPIFVTYMYTALGTRWTFGILFFALAFTIMMMLLVYKRLVPMRVTRG